MEKTYKEIREDLARKYNDKRNELNRTLDSLHNLGYSEEEINTIRKDLINNLQDSLKSEEYYDESYSAYAEEYNAQRAVNRAEEEKNNSEKNIILLWGNFKMDMKIR